MRRDLTVFHFWTSLQEAADAMQVRERRVKGVTQISVRLSAGLVLGRWERRS